MSKLLEMKNIRKCFPGVVALDNVSLDIESGEVLALLGENGAGKSTLMKILSGAYTQDEGEIFLEGEKMECKTPGEIIEKGIAVMYQELNYLNDLSIAENIYLGNLPMTKYGNVDYKELYADVERLMKIVGLERDPRTEAWELSVAEKQMMEIAKVLSKNNKVLVMDEPTAALNETEIQKLFKLIRELTADGKAIIYISHKMDEIFEISDRVEVLRDGKYIGTKRTKETNARELVSMMVGRDIDDMYPKEKIECGDVALKAHKLCGKEISNVSFEVKQGEILGFFGLMGSGRTEIMETIFGVRSLTSGYIEIDGEKVVIKNPEAAIKAGIAYVPRERKSEGLVLEGTVKENMTLAYLKELKASFGLKLKQEKDLVAAWINKLEIKTPSMNAQINSLSGGNQQKVVLAKWLVNRPKVLILNEPTRGVDVGAKVEIYKLIEDLCKEGLAIIMISSETPEIMGISDRILVVCEGRINGECSREEFEQERLMMMAIGGKEDE